MSISLALFYGFLVVAGAALISFKLAPMLMRFVALPEPRFKLAEQLHFKSILSDGVTLCSKEGHLYRVFELEGVDDSSFKRSEVDSLRIKKNRFLIELSVSTSRLKTFHIRDNIKCSFEADFGKHGKVISKIHNKILDHFKNCYRNRIFFVLEQRIHMDPINKVVKIKPSLSRLEEDTQILLTTLDEFKPKLLTKKPPAGDKFSPLLSFWVTLVNLKSMKMTDFDGCASFNDALVYTDINYEHAKKLGVIEVGDGAETTFHKFISINAWLEYSLSSEKMMNAVLSLPYEMTIFTEFTGYPKVYSLGSLKHQKAQARMFGLNTSSDDDYETAIGFVESGDALLCDFQYTFQLQANSLGAIKQAEEEVRRILLDFSVGLAIEKDTAEYVYNLRLPGPTLKRFLNRGAIFLTHNVAHAVSLKGNNSGLVKSDWGDGPLHMFKNTSGGAYYYTHHKTEAKNEGVLGSVLSIGIMGGGKTVLAQVLTMAGLRFPDYHAVIFDRFNGCKIFCDLAGGGYNDPKDVFHLNPVDCDGTKEDLSFLQEFLLMLAGLDKLSNDGNQEIAHSPADIKATQKALKIIFGPTIPRKDRILRRLFLDGVFDDTPLKQGLEQWAVGLNSHYFNGSKIVDGKEVAYDSLSFKNRLTGFELGELLDKPSISAPIIKYIFHKLKSGMPKGAPHLLFFDEATALFKTPLLARHMESVILESRKLRGVPILNVQTVKAIMATKAGEAILGTTPRIFVFPNKGESEEALKKHLKLTERELDFVLERDNTKIHTKRPVLLKT